jgi:hypothetical protein
LGQMGMGGQSGFSPMMNPYGNMGGFRMWWLQILLNFNFYWNTWKTDNFNRK